MNIPSNYTLSEILSVLELPEIIHKSIDELIDSNESLECTNIDLEDTVSELENKLEKYKELVDNIFRSIADRTTYTELANDIKELYDESGIE